jgi:CheY-like chemotaxis protein
MKRILIVDDNPADLILIQEAFVSAGLVDCQCSAAPDGEEALRILRSPGNRQADLVVVDLNLPKTPGVELVQSMRRDPALAGIPIVVWSSSIIRREAELLNELGVECIIKPSRLEDYEEIGKRLDHLIDQRSHRAQSAE